MKQNRSIDSILDGFNISDSNHAPKSECQPLTLWVPAKVKEDYDALQGRTKQRFGKVLKEVVAYAVEKKIGEAS